MSYILIVVRITSGYKSVHFIPFREPFHVAVANVAQPLIQKTGRERVGTQELSPWIGSHMGNQACIVPRLL